MGDRNQNRGSRFSGDTIKSFYYNDRMVSIQDKQFFVREMLPKGMTRGSGDPVVVFLHEGLGSVGQWKDFPAVFLEKCQMPVLLYDRLGYGKSSPRTGKRGLDYLQKEEKWLHRLLEALSVKNYFLLGHSEGGSLALIHAASHPEGLLGVITLSANTEEEPCITPGIEAVRRQYEKPDAKLKQALRKYHGDRCDEVFYDWCDTWTAPFFQSWNIKEALKSIAVPVLAFHGRNDQYTSLKQVENIRQYVQGPKEIHVLAPCSHHPHFDHPHKIMEAVCRFLKR